MEESQLFFFSKFVDMLRELTEVLIWSDKNAEFIFDSFFEWDMISTFERIVTNAEIPPEVKVQTIQCVTMMLQNLTRKSSVYFLCSNNHLNRIISFTFDESNDELLSVYISFLKSLALRLNDDTVHFFFERETHAFPLFDRASKLLSAPDRMVRAAARQIVLSIAQLTDPAIMSFLKRALSEVFCLIANLLFFQIKSLGEVTAGYGTVGDYKTACGGSQLPTLGELTDRLEDVVDDLFYVNDFFSVPHEFVLPCLEDILEKIVISPLVSSLEVTPCCFFAHSHCSSALLSSSSSYVPTSTALFVLTRWLLLNKLGRLQHLFKKHLLANAEGDGGPVGRLLKSGNMQNMFGALMLLDAMATCGILTIKKYNSEKSEEELGASDVDSAVRNSLKKALAFDFTEIADENQRFNQNSKISFPLPNQWETPSCEEFVNRMCQQVSDANTRLWCGCILAAIYHFITLGACARLSAVDLALDLLFNCVQCPRERFLLLKGLLFLCILVLRQRIVVYAECLDLRRRENSKTSMIFSPSTATATNETDEWLVSSYELLFMKLSRICKDFDPDMPCLRRDLSKNVKLLLPLLPTLNFLQTQLTKNNMSGSNNNKERACLEVLLRHREDYILLQKGIAAMVACRDRAAHDEAEEEEKDFFIWLTVRYYACRVLNEKDGLIAKLCSYGPCHQPNVNVNVLTGARMCCRCEFVKGRFLFGASPPKAAAGTPMYMVLYNTNVVFLAAEDGALPCDQSATFCAMFVLQLIYVRAVMSRAHFSVVITHAHPDSPLQLHVVFRHRRAAKAVVDMITNLSIMCKVNGAALVFNALNLQDCLFFSSDTQSALEVKS